MKKSILTFVCLWILWTNAFTQEKIQNPEIIKTIPEFGDCNVKADLKEIEIQFNQEMQGGVSIIDSRYIPQISAKPYWKDKKTFIIPVNLASDRMYVLYFNNQKFSNFRNIDGLPLQPTELIFKTSTLDYKKLNAKAYEELFNYFPSYYSYSDLKGINWKQEFEKRKKEFLKSNSNIDFAINLLSVLKQANDPHLYLEIKGERYYSGSKRITTPNYIRTNSIFKMLEEKKYTSDFQFVGGKIGDVGYISIKNWNFEIENLQVNCWGYQDSVISIQDYLTELCQISLLSSKINVNHIF